MAFRDVQTNHMATWIRSIGIGVIETSLEEETFIPGIRIAEGVLQVDEAKLLYPGDLLHEAGHIAMVPTKLRRYATDNVGRVAEIGDSYEVEAIAWSWAAVTQLGIDAEVVFHNNGYKGAAARLLMTYRMGVFIGLKRMEEFGMAYGPAKAAELGLPCFPVMRKWLRD